MIRFCVRVPVSSHVLLEATGEGHCALPRELLLENAVKVLEIDTSIIAEALARMLVDGQVVEESNRRPNRSSSCLHCDSPRKGSPQRSGNWPKHRAATRKSKSRRRFPWCEGKTGKSLAIQQKEAIRQALASRVMVMTGGPGVGKTTLVNSLLKILRAKQVKCLLAAPDRQGGQTAV